MTNNENENIDKGKLIILLIMANILILARSGICVNFVTTVVGVLCMVTFTFYSYITLHLSRKELIYVTIIPILAVLTPIIILARLVSSSP